MPKRPVDIELRLGPFEFRPTVALTMATLLTVGGCIRLGLWQIDRADQKAQLREAIAERMNQAPLDLAQALPDIDSVRYRRAYVQGVFAENAQVLLDNRIVQGRPGYHVLTPLRVSDTQRIVLVNRGWIPAGYDRTVRPRPAAPPIGSIEVHGRLDTLPAKPFAMGAPKSEDWGWRWPYIDLGQFHRQFQLDPEPYVLLQETQPADAELLRDWPLPDTGGQRHIAYAIQWFAFALIGTVVYFKMTLQKPSSEPL